MRKELKRLFMGFIYSLMTFSFIMMPIPFSGLAHAQRGIEVDTYKNEDGKDSRRSVYKQGDDLGEAVNDAKAENYGETQEGIKAFIAQATTGMMALSLLNALFFKYKYEDEIEGVFYGQDCPKNKAAKVTIRVAQLGSLMYIIGDVSANFKFTKAAAKASDELQNFNPTEKTDFENMTEEEMKARREADPEAAENAEKEESKQLMAFDKLLNILNGKKDAIEAKKKMTTIASLAYGVSTTWEIVNLIKCATSCTIDDGVKKAQRVAITAASGALLGPAITTFNAAASALDPTMATKAIAAACKGLITTVKTYNGKIKVKDSKDKLQKIAKAAKLSSDSARVAIHTSATTNAVRKALTEQDPETAVLEHQAIDAAMDAEQKAIEAHKKASVGKGAAQLAAEKAAETAANSSIAGFVYTCNPGLVPLAAKYLLAYKDYAYQPVTCCGGDGIGTAQQVERRIAMKSFNAQISALGGAGAIAEAKDAKETALQIAKDLKNETLASQQVDLAKGQVANLAADFIGVPGIGNFTREALTEQVNGSFVTGEERIKGSYPALGLPSIPMLNFNNDIVLGGILGKYSSNETPSPSQLEEMKKERLERQNKMFEMDEGSKFFASHMFESMLRRMSARSIAESDFISPKEDFKLIAEKEQEIKNIMFFYNQMLDEVNPSLMADNKMNKHRYWEMIVNMASNLILPKAHAFIGGMGGGGTLAIAGAFLPQIGQMLGLPPEWNAILKVGQKIMIAQAMLGGLMKRYGLVSPLGRSITWGVLTTVLLMVRKWDQEAIDKMKERIELVEAEMDRYENSVARRTAGPGKSYQGANYKKNNYQANSQNAGGAFIKTCVNATQGGFKPAGSCPGNTTKSTFETDKPDAVEAKVMTPTVGKAMSTLSNLASKTANGSLKESEISGSNLAEIERMEAAIRAHNDKLTKGLDRFNDRVLKDQKNKPASLASTIAKARNALTGGAGPINGSLAAFGNPSSAPNTIANKKDEDSGIVTPGSNKGGSAGGGGAVAPSAGSFDLDLLGDDMGGEGMADATGDAAGETAAKAEENLNDFEINHDDINKKTEVSIFKILSNRYILSYPKVLEEEMMDAGGGEDAKAPEESKSLEDQLDQVKQ